MKWDCETLLDELDDGTREMIHNRWGAAAWIAVKKLQSFFNRKSGKGTSGILWK